MSASEFDLWIEAEEWPAGEWQPADAVTDVIVTLADGSRWIATFCAFAHVETLRRNCADSGENLGGKYLWASDLVLVDDTSRPSIEAVVRDLIAVGDVPSAFSPHEPEDGATGDGASEPGTTGT